MTLLKYMHERRKDVHKILSRLIKSEVSFYFVKYDEYYWYSNVTHNMVNLEIKAKIITVIINSILGLD